MPQYEVEVGVQATLITGGRAYGLPRHYVTASEEVRIKVTADTVEAAVSKVAGRVMKAMPKGDKD